jgi:dTDP-4-amino-4,6-dideoxygalactose transaminase
VFSLRVLQGRQALRDHLQGRGIECAVYYPRPLHLEPALRHLGYARGDFPHAERAAEQVLALPLFAQMTFAEQDHVINALTEFFGRAARAP